MSHSSQPQHPSDEDAHALDKREKARERQRRKRARDKSASILASFLEGHPDTTLEAEERDMAMQAAGIGKRVGNGRAIDLTALPPSEAARREKIRIAARERQRRHRAGVKAKRMAELGMAIVNPGGGVEQTAIGYTINENGQYEAVLADAGQHPPPPPVPYSVPHPHATPGQTFSSTLLHALSCTPLLKQQLLRTLRFTNEELASFEPVIAAAFDNWDHGRALYYAAHGHTLSQYSPQNPTYSQQYDARDRSYRPFPPASAIPDPQDADDSASASDESHHPDESDKRGTRFENTETVKVGMKVEGGEEQLGEDSEGDKDGVGSDD